MRASGNCYKVRLTAALLGMPLERREYDIMKGETRTPEFLPTSMPTAASRCSRSATASSRKATPPASISPTARTLIPTDRFDHADMLRWMFWEQYNHEPNIATLRFWMRLVGHDKLTDAAAACRCRASARRARRR